MADEERGFYAVQFHPEVTHTLKGKEMIARFVHDICACGHDWNMPDYVNEAIARVRAQVRGDEVILGHKTELAQLGIEVLNFTDALARAQSAA